MSAPLSSSLTCSGLSFAWPDGTVVLHDLSWTAGPGRTGLIGSNGSGKSTLLKLMSGLLTPDRGTIQVNGEIGYLAQDLTLTTSLRVDEVLGIARARAALHAVEAGDVSEEHFEAIGDDWDVEERTQAALTRLGLDHIRLDHTIGEVSGGEAILLRLAALLLARPEVLLLDEPTNNLDRRARHRLYEAVARYGGAVITVSHDRELLEQADQIVELREGRVRTFGGNLTAYEEQIATEQSAAERTVNAAKAEVAREKRELADAQTRQARGARYGKKMYADNRVDKATMQFKKRSAQESGGKQRSTHDQRLASAQDRLGQAEDQVRDDEVIRLDLPDTTVPPGRTVLTMDGARLRSGAQTDDLEVRGPQRIALTGDNGSGKTTLLRTLTGELPPERGQVTVRVPLRHLPQRLDLLDGQETIVDNIARLAPQATPNQIRAQLARFLVKGKRADQQVATLSGGERFRATLAALLLAEPAPQLLLLDEPTNNLDLASVHQLTQALAAYRGALIVASHDLPFLHQLGITRWLHLDNNTLSRAVIPTSRDVKRDPGRGHEA
jgi:ATPase subunit of ABC transporter with duplicated ATPase domains